MFRFIKTHKKLILYLGLGFIALFLFLLNLYSRHQPPKLVATLPEPDSTKVSLNAPITLIFSKPITTKEINLRSFPEEQFKVTQTKPNQLTFTHQLAFYQNRAYIINIYYHQELIYTLHFTTIKSQNDPRQIQLLELKTKQEYPLAKYTPYETNQFEVVYTAPKTLQITLKQPKLNRNLILNQVRQWVKNHGQDPSSHQYVFKQLQPYRSTI